jgi:hypothetical protein
MRRRKWIDPDLTRRDEAPYWAAALVLAIRAGDTSRADTARQKLQRLGVNVTYRARQRKAVHDGR